MKQAGVKIPQLARALDISYQAVSKVLAGGQFNTDNNAAAAKYLGVSSDWLATGKGPGKPGEAAGQQPELKLSMDVKRKVLGLSDEELRVLENVMRAHLDMPWLQASAGPNKPVPIRDKLKESAYSAPHEQEDPDIRDAEVNVPTEHAGKKNYRRSRGKGGQGA